MTQFPVPFASGDSPFHLKGVGFRGHFAHYEKDVPGGVKAVIASIDDGKLKAFAAQPFTDAQSYDVFGLCELDAVAAKMIGQPFEKFVSSGARLQAERDTRGVYAVFLRFMSFDKVLEKLPALVNNYFDFAPSKIEKRGPGNWHFTRERFPEVLVPWYSAVSEGYMARLAERTRCENYRMAPSFEPSPEKDRGLAIGTMHFTFEWSA